MSNKSWINFILLFGAYGFAFIYIAWRHYKNIQDGGHRYLQGDWMINFADGPVRRGLSGEVFLGLGEALGIAPLYLLGAVQLIVLALVFGTLLYVALTNRLSDGITLALLSPALVLFWVNDEYTPFRKELLGYLTFVPLFLFRTGAVSNMRLGVATGLLAIAVMFHEANAAFFIPLALVFWLLAGRPRAMPWIAALAAVTLTGTVFSLLHMSVPGTDGMCQRVVAAGASPEICAGSMSWLAKDFGQVVTGGWELVGLFASPRNFLLAFGLVVVLFGALALVFRQEVSDRTSISVLALGFVSLMPLYVLGGDWGRWVSIQMFVSIFLLFALAERQALPRLGGTLPLVTYIGVLGFNLFVGVFHMVPTPKSGFAQTFVNGIYNFIY